MSYTIINDNNIDYLKTLKDNSVDSIITDPPYGIEFLGKDWDKNTGAVETWQECLRVLKPGGHLLAFSAARTYHHLATNIESVGFEVRDQLMWLYASGFPKAQDIGKAIDRRMGKKDPNFKGTESFNLTFGENPGQRLCVVCKKDQTAVYKCDRTDCGQKYQTQTEQGQQWAGWKTSMKPAHEPIVMARKPFKGSTIDNVLEHGVGALNIDATRIPYENEKDLDTYLNNIAGPMERSKANDGDNIGMHEGKTGFKVQKGKVKRPSAGNRTSSFHNATGGGETQSGGDGSGDWTHNEQGRFPSNVIGEVEGYQKYFYCPKVSRAERHVGFYTKDIPTNPDAMYVKDENGKCGERYEARVERERTLSDMPKPFQVKHGFDYRMPSSKNEDPNAQVGVVEKTNIGNNHPTVKPVELMKWLITLVTPKGGTVLDPFTGSGSTGMAAVELNCNFIGCELDAKYVEIAKARIQGWQTLVNSKKSKETVDNTFDRLFTQETEGSL